MSTYLLRGIHCHLANRLPESRRRNKVAYHAHLCPYHHDTSRDFYRLGGHDSESAKKDRQE